MKYIRKFFGHLHTVLNHKWNVFKLCCRAGIVWQGIVHDMSKFSPTEFWESVKYYDDGKKSPLHYSKLANGYSKAWLHHKGRNKHHYEYWYDYACDNPTPIIPYKYAAEMVCDTLAAGIVYNGKDWRQDSQLEYWNRTKSKARIHPKIEAFLDEVYTEVAQNGINKTVTKENLRRLYDKNVNKQ